LDRSLLARGPALQFPPSTWGVAELGVAGDGKGALGDEEKKGVGRGGEGGADST